MNAHGTTNLGFRMNYQGSIFLISSLDRATISIILISILDKVLHPMVVTSSTTMDFLVILVVTRLVNLISSVINVKSLVILRISVISCMDSHKTSNLPKEGTLHLLHMFMVLVLV